MAYTQRIIPFNERVTERIKVGKIATKLQQHVMDADKTPMTQTQINAARILLNKCVPDLKALEIKDIHQSPDDPNGITNDRLRSIISGECSKVTAKT